MATNAIVMATETEAKDRGDRWIPRDFIVEALEMVRAGKREVRWSKGEHPSPSMKDIYAIASELYRKAMRKSKWYTPSREG